jgi:virulence factor
MTMRIAIIGLGGIAAKAYLPLLTVWEGIEVLLCSRTPATVEQLQAQYRLPQGTTDLDELLSWEPQAAFVLTPSPTHRVIAGQILEAGVDVFVEKPATMRSAETQELAELAEARERVLMVSFNRRYAPLHRQARELWGDRAVGLCVLEKHRPSAAHPDLFSNYIDDTIHVIDLLRFFCGDGEVVGTVQHRRQGRLVGAVSTVALLGGGYGMVVTSLQAGRWTERYALHGDGTTMYLDAFSRLRLITEEGEQVWEEDYASTWKTTLEARGFANQVAHFFECVRSRRQPLTSGWEALKTQLLLEEMVSKALG